MSILFAQLEVHADGGTVQLHAASGPFIVTIFTQPDSLRVGPVDISILVQERETGEVLLDATVDFACWRVADVNAKLVRRAERSRPANKLLQSAAVALPAPGWWSIQVFVSHGGRAATVATNLLVLPEFRRLEAIWPFLLIPPLAIGLFILHQSLRHPRVSPKIIRPGPA